MATENIWVEKRPNWIQRTFTPFPYVYLDYGDVDENCRAHLFAVGITIALMCCGLTIVGVGFSIIWLALMMLGFTGLFHMRLESMDWEKSK